MESWAQSRVLNMGNIAEPMEGTQTLQVHRNTRVTVVWDKRGQASLFPHQLQVWTPLPSRLTKKRK